MDIQAFEPAAWVPPEVGTIKNHQTDLPRIAKDARITGAIEVRLAEIPTSHDVYLSDSRKLEFLQDNSVQLVVTSPPYWTLKEYRDHEHQIGHIADYETFLGELDKVWRECLRVLVPGGRLVCVVGDVCLSRRKNKGEHTVVPLHSSIQEHCRKLGTVTSRLSSGTKSQTPCMRRRGMVAASLGSHTSQMRS
jgi:DNA modification methylase